MDFGLTFLMRQRWQDPTMMFPDIPNQPMVEGNTILSVPLRVLDDIWQPGNHC